MVHSAHKQLSKRKRHRNIFAKKTGADKHGEKEGVEVLELLESIDDDLDRLGVGMVKISETSAAK